jgi:hypothetical protein
MVQYPVRKGYRMNISDKTIQRLAYTHKDFSDRYIIEIAILHLSNTIKENPDKIREEYGSFFVEHLEEVNK